VGPFSWSEIGDVNRPQAGGYSCLSAPVAQNTMPWSGGGVIALGDDQFAATKSCQGNLDGAFRQARCICNRAKTRGDRFPFLPRGLAIKVQINQISSGFLIVADQISHQDVENIVVDGNGPFEARHAKRMKEEIRIMKSIR
jgi:hypothetical protein